MRWTDHKEDGDRYNYMLDGSTLFWRTSPYFDNTVSPGCGARQPEGANASKLMGIVHHVLYHQIAGEDTPYLTAARHANSGDSIQDHVDLCVAEHSLPPNIILVRDRFFFQIKLLWIWESNLANSS